MICEAAAVELTNERIIVISIYRPFNDEASYYEPFLECLYNMLNLLFCLKPGYNAVLCADFNKNFNNKNCRFKRKL